jgi:hypothetical protein
MTPGSPPRIAADEELQARGFAKPRASIDRKIVSFQLSGNLLDQLMAAGDVLALGSLPKSEYMGPDLRILVLAEAPRSIAQHGLEADGRFKAAWSKADGVQELWCVRTMECRQGVFSSAETLFYVERCSGLLILLGSLVAHVEFRPETSRVEMELWQSPVSLRQQLDSDIVAETVSSMVSELIVFGIYPASPARGDQTSPVTREPINTSPVVAFWQLYLCRLATCRGASSGELMNQWMPRQDGEIHVLRLWSMLRALGWVAIRQIPMIFQQTVHWECAKISATPNRTSDRLRRSNSPTNSHAFKQGPQAWPENTSKNNIHDADMHDISFDDRIALAVDIAFKCGVTVSDLGST